MLTAESITCRRGGRTIFRDLQFTLSPGDVLLVTGANGSGKSSLLRMLAGLLPPESGTVAWRGQNIAHEPDHYHRNLHYVGHLDAVKPELTVTEMLDYWRTLSGLNLAAPFPDHFGVLAWRDKPGRYLSAGQKRQLALSRLILKHAALWLLDEPTITLDSAAQAILLDGIEHHRASGGIAVIATHQSMHLPDAIRLEMSEDVS